MFCSVTYLRLDGSVDPEKRFEIVKAFNSDPTIDVLLLTTHGMFRELWNNCSLICWESLL